MMLYRQPEQVITNFNNIHEKIKPKVDQLLDLQPKTPFQINRIEAFREASAAAHYNSGSLDGTRPGIFYAPIPNVSQYNVYTDEALFYTKPFLGITSKYPYSKKIKIYPVSEKTFFIVHFQRVGCFILNHWVKN